MKQVLLVILLLTGCEGDPGYNGRTSEDWMAVLADSALPVDRRVDAALALKHVLDVRPHYDEVIKALLGALHDGQPQVRLAAGAALASDRLLPPDAAPWLLEILNDSIHPAARSEAALLLGRIGPPSPDTVTSALREALRDGHEAVRGNAALSLGLAGRRGDHVTISELSTHLADSSVVVRSRVIEALLKLQVDTLARLQLLQQAMVDVAPEVRRMAANIAGALGKNGSPMIQPLASLLGRDSIAEVRRAAAFALGAIGAGSADARRALENAAADADPITRSMVQHALRDLRGDPEVRVP